jgi:hypothetical protein
MKRYIVAVVAMALFMAALVTISPLSGAQTVTIQNQKTGLRKPSPSPTPTPSSKTATWTGNGAYYDGGDFTLTDSRCEESGGEPYLYWVLTAGGKDSINGAAITINGSGPYAMTRQRNGSFKYTQTFENNTPDSNSVTSFVVPTTVTATFTRAKSANLVISHGCTGELPPPPPVCDPNATQLEYKMVLVGISGSYGAEPFTNQTLTINDVGKVADVNQDGSNRFTDFVLSKPKITVSGTTLNEATLDRGMRLLTFDLNADVAVVLWQNDPVDLYDLADHAFSTSIAPAETRLTSCWISTWPPSEGNGGFTSYWNTDVAEGRVGVRVGGIDINITEFFSTSGYMTVGPVPTVTTTEVKSFKR